jgi:hypothetical protein
VPGGDTESGCGAEGGEHVVESLALGPRSAYLAVCGPVGVGVLAEDFRAEAAEVAGGDGALACNAGAAFALAEVEHVPAWLVHGQRGYTHPSRTLLPKMDSERRALWPGI